MPTYLYKCPTHGEFEEEHSIRIKLEFCPKCEAEGNPEVKIERLINCVSRGVVELQGNELIDKLKSDAQQIKKDAAKSEKVYADLLGHDKYESVQRRMDAAKRDRKNY